MDDLERRLLELRLPPLTLANPIDPISRIRPISPIPRTSPTNRSEAHQPETTFETIGHSRKDRPLHAAVLGQGPHSVSIIAGCHADEPAGPITAHALPQILADAFPELLERFRFHIIPQMNPDGAERNRAWFSTPLSFAHYAAKAVREQPGDDVEFGFGKGPDTRPECAAVMTFLERHAPYCAHFSLHGMGYSQGAWFLLCREWAERAEPLMDSLECFTCARSFPLHDIDRHGEKGFWRIRPGFCTTPTSTAMRDYFLQQNDPETAARFRPSSMEFTQSLGGDPLCMVSEIPLFRIGLQHDPKLGAIPGAGLGAAYTSLKEELDTLRDQTTTPDPAELTALAERYALAPVPLDLQVRLQIAVIVLALRTLPLP